MVSFFRLFNNFSDSNHFIQLKIVVELITAVTVKIAVPKITHLPHEAMFF